jgi:hypothetical protein
MFENECNNCRAKNSLLEEKDRHIRIFQNNLFEIKNKMLESNNMINVYVDYKNENENLKNEVESLRKKVTEGGNPQQAYEVKSIY